jgi:hypothetical protein
MHATFWCATPGDAAPAHPRLAARALVTRLSALPGFVAYVALAGEGGSAITALCICEDAASLAAANGLIAAWGATQDVGENTGREAGPALVRSGTVIAQWGL